MATQVWSVYYTDSIAGGLVRRFPSEAKAQEFIDNNAMVFPLPNCRLVDESSRFYPDTSNHFPSTEDADGF
jgi:hypothetical protein